MYYMDEIILLQNNLLAPKCWFEATHLLQELLTIRLSGISNLF